MRIGIAFNPRSGTRRGDQLHRMTRAAIVGAGHSPHFLPVESTSRLEDCIRREIDGLDAVAAIGGDGTLNGVVNGILTSSKPETPVAFFPTGRGRDTARSVPSWSPESLSREVVSWRPSRRVDAGSLTLANNQTRYFINASSIGLSGEAARIAARLPRQTGSFSYIIGAAMGFLSSRGTRVRLQLGDGETVTLDDTLLIAVCNGRAFGGGIYIAPEAAQDDGFLEIVAVRNADLLDLLTNLPRLRKGVPFDHPAISRWRTRSATLVECSLAPIELDGELWGEKAIRYSIIPNAVNWIGPDR